MKMIVLGGSPKGEKSVTMQYVEYLKLKFPEVSFDVKQPAFRIRRLEQSPEVFDDIIKAVSQADGVLWAFPLYVHSVCSQYHRFIELIDEREAGGAFAGKPAAALSTSIHFFDNTAHDFIRAVSEDLGMAFVDSHSANMNDLMKPAGRRALEGFFDTFMDAIGNGAPVVRIFPPRGTATDEPAPNPGSATMNPEPLRTGKRITIVTDSTDGRLATLINRFSSTFEDDVEIVDLRKLRIAGGCMGCLHCGPKNVCRYGNTDDVINTYIEKIHPADVFVIAATIKRRWYSSLMKSFIDRGFFHTHQPFLNGKQVAVLLDGDITSNPALRDGLTGFVEWQGGSLNGIVTTMSGNASEVDAATDSLTRRIALALKKDYLRPATFLGVGGIKIFRDDIYTRLSIVFRGDHKYYRKNGIYKTLPHKKPLRLMMFRLIGLITSFPPINRKMVVNMKDFMLMPYRGVLKKATTTADTSEVKDRSSVA